MINRTKQAILFFTGIILYPLHSFCQNPVAGFTPNQTSGCSPLTVQFNNTSVGGTSYFWDFGNGNTSVLANPTNVYTQAGSYTVKLFATSAGGQTDSLISTNLITVSANSVPDFHVQNPTACLNGNTISFINTSTNASGYLWDFGDGITSTLVSPSHSYVLPGNYTIKLVTYDTYGCPSIKTQSNYIHINPNPVAEFSVNTNSGCGPAQLFNFTTNTAATNLLWEFGDGTTSTLQNPSHSYSNSGTYSVKLTATNNLGCSHSSTSFGYISIETPIVPAFTSTTNGGCIPVEATFQNQTAFAVDFVWNFGDGTTSTEENPVHVYSNSGNYNVSLTTISYTGCQYTTTLNNHIIVGNNPVANFSTGNPGSCSAAIPFNNLSTNAVSQLWEFGDGYTSTLANPSHKYSEAGSFNVILHVYNSSGCESVKQVANAVNLIIPVANFTTNYTPGCAPLTANFANTSENAVQWLWNFGDGTTSTLHNPVHTYTLPGNYNVGLIAIDAQGCSDTVVFYSAVQVINTTGNFVTPPTVNGCAPFHTSFSNISTTATSWLWNFGDGSTSTLQSPSHTYTTAGTYTVSLTVMLSSGCTQYYPSFRIFDIRAAQAEFTVSAQEICASTAVSFNSSSSVTLLSNLWEFGDGSISTQQNPSHTYVIPGYYTVKYTATTTDGCSSSIIKANCIHASSCSSGGNSNNNSGGASGSSSGNTNSSSPTVSVTGCVPFVVNFTNPLPSTVSWLWNFGDGSTSTIQHPQHTYTSTGNYTVTLTAQTSSGNTQTVTYTNYVQAVGAPADFTMTENGNCQSGSVTLSSGASSNVTSWHWDFGDGYTSSAQSPTHTYTDPTNNYIATLTTSTAQGCYSSLSKSLLLASSTPVIWANDYEICMNQTVNFSCLTGNYTSYLWNFGDGFSSALPNPAHVFQGNGLFAVTLQTTDSKGCTRITTLQPGINVTKSVASFNYALVNGCDSKTVAFTNTSTGAASPVAANSKWNFGDGTPEQWAGSPTHIYSSQGTYVVTLTIYNNGCSNSITKTIYVNPVSADFSFTQNTSCLPATATFADASTPAVSWLWDFGDGTTSNLQNPVHTYITRPTVDITLTITSANGCQATITKASLTLFNTDLGVSVGEGCSPLFVEFYDGSSNANQWKWDFGDGTSSTSQNPTHTYVADGTYNVRLISQSAEGCKDTAEFSSIVTNKPHADFSSSSTSSCSPALVNFTDLSVNAVSWLWDFGDGSTSVNQNPGHVYNIPGLYSVTLIITNVFGCNDTLVKSNHVQIPGSLASFSTSAIQACAKTQVQFTDLSVNATSWNWNFGDGNTSTQKNPENIYQNPGQYTVSLVVQDANGCSSSFSLQYPITINPLPTVNYGISDSAACTPFPVMFYNLSQNAVSYSWNFGDGSSSSVLNPSHTYTTFGTYYTSLTATNQFGCTATKSFGPIYAKKTPAADFIQNITAGCSPLLVSFQDNSLNTGTTTYLWNLGNSSTSVFQNPSATYTNPGFYTISLIVTNNNGCKDTLVKQSIVQVYDIIPPPASSLRVVSVTSDTSVQITWNQSDAEDFASYKIYRKDNTTGIYTTIATISSRSQTSFTDGGRNTVANSYCYKIQTTDVCGYAQPLDSLEEHCTVNISAHGVNDDILLSWTPYIGAQPETYSVYRLEANMSGPALVGTVPGNVLELTDTALICPSFYSYRVKANKLNGQLVSSNSDTCIAKPANNVLIQQKVDVVRSTVIENSKVLTEWKAPVIAPEKVAGYAIYRSTNANSGFSLLENVSALARSYVDEAVDVNAQNYYYRIKVLNFCDIVSGESNKSSSVLLKAELIDGNVNLKWTGYDGWNMGVDYYIIEKQNENGEWEQIKKVDGNKLEYEDNE